MIGTRRIPLVERLKPFSNASRAKPINAPTVLLQTAAVILENPNTKQQVKMKVLLDAGSQKTYISERIRKCLNLSTEAVEDVNFSTFGNLQTLSKSIDRVLVAVKTNNQENILIRALRLPMLCFLISSPSITFLKGQFEKFHGIEFVDKGSEKDIDLLIGPDLHWSFVMRNIVKSRESGGLVVIETKFECD